MQETGLIKSRNKDIKQDSMIHSRREFLGKSIKVASAFSLMGASVAFGADKITESTPQKIRTAKLDSTLKQPATIQQRKIGDFSVSALGLGCMGMSANHGPARDTKEMTKLLHRAIELGINHFDTAEIYGPHTNEELLGKALKPYRDKITINTKFGLYYPFGKQMQDSSPKALRRALDGSLKRLQTDYVDLYTQHRVDTDTPIEEVAQTMQKFVKEGKIRAWALGEAGSKTIERACKEFAPAAMQSQYSMAFRELDSNGIMATCERLGVTLVAYSPLDRGFLTGAMNENTTFHPTLDFRAGFPRYTKEALRANQSIIKFIDEIAQSKRVGDKKGYDSSNRTRLDTRTKAFYHSYPRDDKSSAFGGESRCARDTL